MLDSTRIATLDYSHAIRRNGFANRIAQENATKEEEFTWEISRGAQENFYLFGKKLAEVNQNLFRNGVDGHGLILVVSTGRSIRITKASQLTPVIADCLNMKVTKEGKTIKEFPSTTDLNTLLKTEQFLQHFRPVDRVTAFPNYDDVFGLVAPGYNPDSLIYYAGDVPQTGRGTETIERFLDVMSFGSNADRTNAVAAALTVMLRHLWPGHKPMVLVTANKSHSGKGTVTDFIRGPVPTADLLYQQKDWPIEKQLQSLITANPDTGILLFDNVRQDSSGTKFIRSGFVESFITSEKVTLASPGCGDPLFLKNQFVVALNTNDGKLSTDLLNRALPIHLEVKGNVQERQSPIGNPKLEFLPQFGDQIQAELRGMIESWKEQGRPLDESARHSMSVWAKTIGGILRVNGFSDFLENMGQYRSLHDQVREALAIIATVRPGEALPATEWAQVAVKEGLGKVLFNTAERDTEAGRARAMGVLLSRHQDETFEGTTDTTRFRFELEKKYGRWGRTPHYRYIFHVLVEEHLPDDDSAENVKF